MRMSRIQWLLGKMSPWKSAPKPLPPEDKPKVVPTPPKWLISGPSARQLALHESNTNVRPLFEIFSGTVNVTTEAYTKGEVRSYIKGILGHVPKDMTITRLRPEVKDECENVESPRFEKGIQGPHSEKQLTVAASFAAPTLLFAAAATDSDVTIMLVLAMIVLFVLGIIATVAHCSRPTEDDIVDDDEDDDDDDLAEQRAADEAASLNSPTTSSHNGIQTPEEFEKVMTDCHVEGCEECDHCGKRPCDGGSCDACDPDGPDEDEVEFCDYHLPSATANYLDQDEDLVFLQATQWPGSMRGVDLYSQCDSNSATFSVSLADLDILIELSNRVRSDGKRWVMDDVGDDVVRMN